jgi:hypothetical protein
VEIIAQIASLVEQMRGARTAAQWRRRLQHIVVQQQISHQEQEAV